jgi:hypothetical protein
MKKIITLIIATILLAGGAASAAEFTLTGPHQADFDSLVNYRHSHLKKSLYHLRTDMYRWPINLAIADIVWDDYVKDGIRTAAFRKLFTQ